MNPLCSGCGRPPHAGGCKLVATQPAPPSEEETQRRRAYLESDEFKKGKTASLAGRNPAAVKSIPGATTALHARLAKISALLKDARAYASRRGLSPTEKLAGVRQFLDLAIEKADG